MNLQLPQVLSEVAGVSGLAIIDAILAGERHPLRLAQLRGFEGGEPRKWLPTNGRTG